jgi:2-C-methyl-D-erythritol 2,4-cyclodiphosphate synthase
MERIGTGIDFHRFAENRKLILGGIEIEHHLGLLGHSDADCLIHAVVDAILGALGNGDIGAHFPDNDPRYKNVDSVRFLEEAAAMVLSEGYQIANIDTTIICEEPRIRPHAQRMRERVAAALNISPGQVNIKGKTTEQMGFLGRKEGIACMAVALLKKR